MIPQILLGELHNLIYIGIDSKGRLRTKLYDTRYDFNFPIVNFLFICRNIPASPAYVVYDCQLIRYIAKRNDRDWYIRIISRIKQMRLSCV